MAKLEWGNKHICSDCNTKFYDMRKSTPECPKCGSQVLVTRKPRVGRPPLSQKKPKPTVIKTKDQNEDIPKNLVVEKTDEGRNIEGVENIKEIEDIQDIEDIENIEDIGEIEEIDNIEEEEDIGDMGNSSNPPISNDIKPNNDQS